MEGHEEVFGTVDICNRIKLPLADIQLKDNGEYLCIKNGSDSWETGFTSHSLNIFFKHARGL